ncbi:MAG: nitrogenase iron-molybdenum cofactor biosynthesis protein NifN [Rhodocyclaceae bacterium]|nr:nitrogenase iron-molybdenum cofactor biosynthesis protein NifN [Rhodocyclaceae bacterium]
MAEIIKSTKALTVNPLKVSQTLGASLAFLGINRAVPLMHGSQGCTAFGKVFFVRHFREPIPLQTTAMDQVSTVMGADENVIEALRTLCEKNKPDLIGVVTTGLSETQGTDIRRAVKEFRAAYPEFDAVAVVPVNTPDYLGCMETGYALAVEAIIECLVPESRTGKEVQTTQDDHHARLPSPPTPLPRAGEGSVVSRYATATGMAGQRPQQVNVLAGSHLTPGDVEAVKEWIEAFGLWPVMLPDIGDSLDGHLVEAEFSPLTLGGTKMDGILSMGESVATLVIGPSLYKAADLLATRTGVPDYRFDSLMGLTACDAFTQALATISGHKVPDRIERQRAQLQDAMVDSHFMLGFTRIAIAADPDLLFMLTDFLLGMGAEIVAAVAPARSESLSRLALETVMVGDLDDLEKAARTRDAQLLIANSHGVQTAARLGVPILRAGFPQYDWVGGYARPWVGYRASRQTLFDIANLLLSQHHDIRPYESLYRDEARNNTPGAGESRAAPEAGVVH